MKSWTSPSSDRAAPGVDGARLTRRILLAGGASLALAGCVTAQVSTPQRYSAVIVDVDTLRAKGLGLFADRVQAGIADAASRLLAGMVNPSDKSAPKLVLRITSVSFTEPMSEGPGGGSGSGESTDYMEGEALIVSKGAVIERVPMLGGYTSRWFDVLNPMGDPLRLQALCDFWVGWMRKKLGG
ncbi:hypothetical protein NK718_00905 [Alsobacter sp. SYSU M60028]|uniref:DUF3016 domain-containing protein n=1 Tax=Alsobacter ponti TaxID=2962936 RepID=A0ABT1L6N3_9HYPH|nr:hypothetical protein [Alsobacter ponti]MCP8937064.1 hypothetical protein [Alsobacter ponti]